MRFRLISLVLPTILGLVGCGSQSESGPVDVNKLQAPTTEQAAEIQKADAKINDEEFGKPMPKSKPAAKK